jgi:peptidoglycan hydrolase-like amidase
MESALSGLVDGRLEQIEVTKRGTSPRILQARLIGSGGTTTITGADLQARLGLRDRWVSFRKTDPEAAARYAKPWAAS